MPLVAAGSDGVNDPLDEDVAVGVTDVLGAQVMTCGARAMTNETEALPVAYVDVAAAVALTVQVPVAE